MIGENDFTEFKSPEVEELSVKDIQDYCTKTDNTILAHGTTVDMLEGIKEHGGLVLRYISHPTVLFAQKGVVDRRPIVEYTWLEPRSNEESCALILDIPSQIIKILENNNLPISQYNIFYLISEKKEFIVNENSYDDDFPIVLRPPGNEFSIFGTSTPKLPIGSKYKKDIIPNEFILGATTRDRVLWNNNDRFQKLDLNRQNEIINKAQERANDF